MSGDDLLSSIVWPPTKYRDIRGHVLRFPRNVVGVPIEYRGDGWWRVVVTGGSNPRYPVGGYDIHVSPTDIAAAERIDLT